jgi:hypothetical protein
MQRLWVYNNYPALAMQAHGRIKNTHPKALSHIVWARFGFSQQIVIMMEKSLFERDGYAEYHFGICFAE